MGKRFISMCLAVVMMLGMLPGNAFAITTNTEVPVYFTTEQPVVDGTMNEFLWRNAVETAFTVAPDGAPTGTMKAVIHKGLLYLGIAHSGAKTIAVELGNKSFAVDATTGETDLMGVTAATGEGTVEIKVDLKTLGMQLLDYTGEIPLQITMSGESVSKQKTAIPIEETADMFSGGGTSISGGSWIVPEAGSYSSSGDKGYLLRRVSTDPIDTTQNTLLEQTLHIEKMPYSASSGTFESHASNGHGLVIHMDDGNGQVWAYLVYPNASGELLLGAFNGLNAAVKNSVNLGKKPGDMAFKLGIDIHVSSGTADVYVDGVKVGTTAATAAAASVYGTRTLLYSYYDSGVSASDPAKLSMSDIAITQYDAIEKEQNVPIEETANMFSGGGTNISGGSWLVPEAGSYSSSGDKGYLLRRVSTDFIDTTQNTLLEQTLHIEKMPYSASSGTFESHSSNGHGLVIHMDDGNGQVWAYLVYPNASGELLLGAFNGFNAAVKNSVNLGKKPGDAAFKLGIDIKASTGTADVYVDGVNVGTTAATAAAASVYGTRTLLYSYYDSGVSASDPAKLSMTGIKITQNAVAEAKLNAVPVTLTIKNYKVRNMIEAVTYHIPIEETADMFSGGGTSISGGSWLVPEAGSYSSSGDKGYLLRRVSTDPIDTTQNTLLEQTLHIEKMPYSASSGTFESHASNGHGLVIHMDDGNGQVWAYLVYPNASGELLLGAFNGFNTAVKSSVNLGKKPGDMAFKLGIDIHVSSGTADVYVDGVKVGTTAATAAAASVYGTRTLLYSYYDSGVSASDPAKLSMSDIAITQYDAIQKEQNVPIEETANMFSGGGTNISGGSWLVPEAGSYSSSGDKGYLLRRVSTDFIDTTQNTLLEQTLHIEKMPYSASSGTFESHSSNGHGLVIHMDDGNGQVWAYLVYPNASGELLLGAFNGFNAAVKNSVNLGKKPGDMAFKLGIDIHVSSGTADVYVDDVKVGTTAATAAAASVYGTRTLLYSYYDSGVSASDPAKLSLTGIKITQRKNEVSNKTISIGTLEEEVTVDAVLGKMNTAALTNTDTLPATFESKYLGQLPLSWTSSDPSILSEQNQFRQDPEEDKQATLTLKIGNKTIWQKTVTVVALRGAYSAYFTTEAPVVNGVMDEYFWGKVEGKNFEITPEGAPTGTMKAAVHKGVLYLGISHVGAETLEVVLGDKTFTVNAVTGETDLAGVTAATAEGVAEIKVDLKALDMQMMDYTGTFAFLVTLKAGGATSCFTDGLAKIIVENARLVNEDDNYLLLEDILPPGETENTLIARVVPGDGFVVFDKSQFPGEQDLIVSGEKGYVLRREPTDFFDTTKDTVIEQTLNIEKMPSGDDAGKFFGSPVMAYGLMTHIDDGNGKIWSYVVYADTEKNLYVGAYNGSEADAISVSLGRKVGDGAFKLTLDIKTTEGEEKTLVYVNGAQVGTIENTSWAESIYGTKTMLLGYYDNACSDEDPVLATVSDFVIKQYNPCEEETKEIGTLAEELSVETVLYRMDLTKLTEANILPATYDSKYLGELPLTWSCSDTAVLNDQNQFQQKDLEEQTATLTLFVNKQKLWDAEVTVAARFGIMEAIFLEEELTMDGKLGELVWNNWSRIRSADDAAPQGGVSAVWNKETLYIGLNPLRATTANFVVNNVAIQVDLASGTVLTGPDGVQVFRDAAAGTVEIAIPMSVIGVTIYDFDLSVKMILDLIGEGGSSRLEKGMIILSGKTVSKEDLSGYGVDSAPGWSVEDGVLSLDTNQDGKLHYAFKSDRDIDPSKGVALSYDLRFDALPISDGCSNGGLVNGFFAYMTNGTGGSNSEGEQVLAVIYRPSETSGLMLKMRNGKDVDSFISEGISLGRDLGDTFRLSFFWNQDNSVDVFLDGQYLLSVAQGAFATDWVGNDVITWRYLNTDSGTAPVSFSINNVVLTREKYGSVMEQLTVQYVLGRMPTAVTKNLPMNDTVSVAGLGEIPVAWKTSDPTVITADGIITRHETEKRTATVSLYVNGQKLWDAEVTVLPASVAVQASPVILTAYTESAVTVDGILSEEGWAMPGRVLGDVDYLMGEVGAQWDKDYLYLAVDTAKTDMDVSFTLNGKRFRIFEDSLYLGEEKVAGSMVASHGTATEIKIPIAALELKDSNDAVITQLKAYGTQISITVAVNEFSYTGTLDLEAVDWWATDNRYHALTVQPNHMKSVSYLGGDPNGYQGVEQTENGWRMYDLYNESGDNTSGVRTYALFINSKTGSGESVYKNFDDRTVGTQVSFDFCANSLPVYTLESGVYELQTFSNFGWSFNISEAGRGDSNHWANQVIGGIINTEDGLYFVMGGFPVQTVKLNKQVGDTFNVGLMWEVNGDLVLSVDGEEVKTFIGAQQYLYAVGNCSFIMNLLRDREIPDSAADSMDVVISNLSFGKAYSGRYLLHDLDFDTIRGENESEKNVISDLAPLPTAITDYGPLKEDFTITWTSSDEATISADGKVTRPETGAKQVVLTATLINRVGEKETVSFDLIVPSVVFNNENTLYVIHDSAPAQTAGKSDYNELLFTLDANNNSMIADLGERKQVNVITLTDLDEVARLNTQALSLWISDDNVTYSRVEGEFKLLHVANKWYIYDFLAEGRYIKVHYTQYHSEDASFTGVFGDMIRADYQEVFGGGNAEFTSHTYTLTNNTGKTQRDYAFTVSKTDLGITGKESSIRIYLGDKLLYHYVDGDHVIIRVTDIVANGSVMLTVKQSQTEVMDIANKEGVYEVTYGTIEIKHDSMDPIGVGMGRWNVRLPANTEFADKSVQEKEAILAIMGNVLYISTDNGDTWTKYSDVNNTAPEGKKPVTSEDWCGDGGFIFDHNSGRLFYQSHVAYHYAQNSLEASHAKVTILASDDGGKHWYFIQEMERDFEKDPQSNYLLSYSDGLVLKDNDGDGPNVDMVFVMSALYNDESAFCSRVAYTTDGGMTWQLSESKMIYGPMVGHEGGVHEGTIMEREDGTLVAYMRVGYLDEAQFAISYSLDHGITWKNAAEISDLHAPATQPMSLQYDFAGTKATLIYWGGNNVFGGLNNSATRAPYNVAVSVNGYDTFRNIQNLYSKTAMEDYKRDINGEYGVTNQSAVQFGEDGFYSVHRTPFGTTHISLRVDNFTDWFTRTKGVYDSFEHGTAKYEGWSTFNGNVVATKEMALAGNYSMMVSANSGVTRSIPYLQNGSTELSIYVGDNADFTLELQSAFGHLYGMKGMLAGIRAENGKLYWNHETESFATLNANDWNTFAFDLDLTNGTAMLKVNDGAAVEVPVDLEVGNYVCFITLNTINAVYVDEVLVISKLDAVLEATDADKAAANEVIDLIKAALESGKAADINAARNAYEALSQVQKDLVDRNVPTGTTDNVNEEGALINYYDALVEAEEEMNKNLPGFSGFLTLNETIDLNLIFPAGVETEGNVVSVKYADGTDADYTIVSTAYGPAIRYRSFSNQMTREITVQIFDGEGNALTKPLTISVRGYVQKLLGVTANDTEKALMIRMLDYGALAQLYAHTNEDDLANSIIDETLRDFINSYDMGTPDAYVPASASTGGVFSANLTLNESVVMNIVTNTSHIGENEKLVVKLDGVALAENQYQLVTSANGKICISYSFHSDKMNQELSVAIVDKDTDEARIEISLSIRKYAHMCLDAYKDTNPTLCTMLVAMLDYGALAQLYAKTATDDLANRYVSAEQRATLTGYPWPEN